MKFVHVALLALLVAAPVSNAQADSNTVLADKLISAARQYQEALPDERARLKASLEEISNIGDEYLSEVASAGEKPSTQLVDASHQVKQLLHS